MTDTDIHSCGYYCDRHACIVAQRNELRDKLFSDQATRKPILPGGGGGSGVLTIDGWPLYSVLSTQEEQGLTATPLPAIKLQDERESQYKSFAQSAQVIGIPKKEWVGLNPKEISEIAFLCRSENPSFFAHAVEAKLKEKNYD